MSNETTHIGDVSVRKNSFGLLEFLDPEGDPMFYAPGDLPPRFFQFVLEVYERGCREGHETGKRQLRYEIRQVLGIPEVRT